MSESEPPAAGEGRHQPIGRGAIRPRRRRGDLRASLVGVKPSKETTASNCLSWHGELGAQCERRVVSRNNLDLSAEGLRRLQGNRHKRGPLYRFLAPPSEPGNHIRL